jgi:hypothetical protein
VADSNVPITAGSGTLIDTQVPTGGDHRQVIVIGDPTTVSGVATVTNNAVNVNLNQGNFVASTNNSSTTQLAAGATFTGTIETILNQPSAQIEIVSDQAFTLNVDQFIDAGGTKLASTDTYTRTAGVPFNENLTLPGNYFRLRVTNNGASTTTTLQVDVTFGIMPTTPRGPSNLGNTKMGLMEINGTAASAGSGTVDAGTLRVTLPSNQSAVATTPAGAAANGAAVTGNPILVGGSDGTNARSLSTDTSGRLIVVPPDTSAAISITANATSSGSITGLTGSGVAMIQLTGTFTATVQVQLTTDGTNWVNITGSNSITNAVTGAYLASGNLTAVGMYMVDVSGSTGVRVITTAYTSGTVTGTNRVVPGVGGSTAISGIPLVAQSGTWTVGVTGYPTAAASADALANPTVTQIGSAGLVFNGTTWDRIREATADGAAATGLVAAADVAYNGATWDRVRSGTFTLNVDTSSARTATGNGTAAVNYAGHKNLTVWINVTAVSGTTPTCVFKLQWSPDNGTTWIDWDTTNLQTTSITAVTTALLKVGVNATTTANASKQDFLPRQIRLVWTIGGTTPSFTFASWYTFTG